MSSEKTKEQLEDAILLNEKLCKEREVSDARYAMKIVEKVVFGLIALILTAVVGAIISLVIINSH
jgi:uncharacterized membrane protein